MKFVCVALFFALCVSLVLLSQKPDPEIKIVELPPPECIESIREIDKRLFFVEGSVTIGGEEISLTWLVDTGAAISVLPYSITKRLREMPDSFYLSSLADDSVVRTPSLKVDNMQADGFGRSKTAMIVGLKTKTNNDSWEDIGILGNDFLPDTLCLTK